MNSTYYFVGVFLFQGESEVLLKLDVLINEVNEIKQS